MRPPLLAAATALASFVLLLWFYVANVYQTRFFDHGGIVVAYQFARFASVFYLLWLQYALGALALFLLLEPVRFIPAFLLGTALLHLILFALGLAGLYDYPVIFAFAALVTLASIPHMARRIQLARVPRLTGAEKWLAFAGGAAGFVFLLVKGVYPSGGHDAYNIYFPYYQAVLRDGSLGPKEVWYAYYYAKGLGLTFLSMILLDPLAPSLATSSMIIAASVIVYDLIAKQAGRALGLLGVFFYFALYSYTPGIGFFAFSGGWGDLEKAHEITGVLMLGVLWLAHSIFTRPQQRRVAGLILCVVCITIVNITLQLGLMIGLFLTLCWLGALRRHRHALLPFFIAACATALAMLAVLCINYLATGMLHEQAVQIFWPLIDWQKLVANGTTLELHMAWNNGRTPVTKTFMLPEFLYMLVACFRLYLLWPLLLVGVICACVRRSRPGVYVALLVILLLGTLAAAFASYGGEPLSFFRLSTYIYAPLLIGALALWRPLPVRWLPLAVPLTILSVLVLPQPRHDWQAMLTAAARFNTGQYSLHEATSDIRGRAKDLASRTPLMGTHPAFVDIYDILPYKTRIWNMDNIAYCMLPACKLEQASTMILSPRWYDLPQLSIAEGRALLQEEGLNYIFYSRDVTDLLYADAKDVLPALYPGLHPDHISDTFGVKWTNGTDYLLTWKDKDTKPLDDAFMASWQRYWKDSVTFREDYFSYAALAPYIAQAARDRTLKHPLPFQ